MSRTMLSVHFSEEEFSCRCGCNTPFTIDPALIDVLERIRESVGEPLTIASGFRCPAHNSAIGGGPEHPAGEAADIEASDSLKYEIVNAAYENGVTRIGVGKTFVHIGVSGTLPQFVLWGYNE